MRSSPLVLLLLIGVQAVLNMGGGRALSTGAANHKVGQHTAANHRAGQHHAAAAAAAAGDHLSQRHSSPEHHRTIHHRTKKPHRASSQTQDRSSNAGHSQHLAPHHDSNIPEVDPKLFSKRRYRPSPRVVFSEVFPPRQEGEGYDTEGGRGVRVRRKTGTEPMHRGEYPVCDSINTWVANMTRATDMSGNDVSVLPYFKVDNVLKKQLFYETTCRSRPGRVPVSAGRGRQGVRVGKANSKGISGCRGIDDHKWNSYCTNSHTYVRALTTFKELTAWRFIRINAACVCVLTRKSWGARMGH